MGAIQSFSSILPTLTGTLGAVQTIAGTVNTIQNLAGGTDSSEDIALQQLQARQSLEEQQLAQDNVLKSQEIALSAQQDEEERQRALRRAVARQRAQFGASGLSASATGGSSDAVLLGLFEESEVEAQQRAQLDNLRINALELDASQTRSINVLQETQLAERQSLSSLF